ncbi:hypothetical protein KUTeg_020216 [Tegillarca granosa]|uniref:YqaJ viral recombinase domain-containing protein n=1 Tax=Tegillarca granosa TaxID=220873 RepID=A0ABQ9E9V6_TEGGR|nr:hypothetical protein KUTeg_020216 [Tegillarca granosa]
MNFAVPFRKVTQSNAAPLPAVEIEPGIIRYLLEKVAQDVTEDKTYKLCFDGKKINSSTSSNLGDVDLFGFEQEPTLSQRKHRLQNEAIICQKASRTFEGLAPDQDINFLLPSVSVNIVSKMVSIIKLLGYRLKDLRTLKASKSATLAKFKEIAGTNWEKKSKLCMVISAISTQIYDIDVLIQFCSWSAIAILNDVRDYYSLDRIVTLKDQGNYQHLNEIKDHEFQENEFRHLKQRSDQWFNAREKSVVTGCTLNAALGLDTLKKQEHFDFVKFGKQKTSPSPKLQEKMDHGFSNEINAVATIVSKVIPVLFPSLSFSEEGCVKINRIGNHMIISPDGSLFDISSKATKVAVEIKCPFPPTPGSYKVPVFYIIPLYYVPQILSEMFALETDTLLFACYSRESTAITQAKFSQELWGIMEDEVQSLYGPNASRPTRKSK